MERTRLSLTKLLLAGCVVAFAGRIDAQCSAKPGYYCPDPAAKVQACAAGSYSGVANSAACTPCPAGTASLAGATTCGTCPAGYTSVAGVCVADSPATASCQAGFVAALGSCIACPAGTFSGAGTTSCKACPSGTASVAGATTCGTCPAGYTSAPGGICVADSPATTSCQAGFVAALGSCLACPAGTFSGAGQTACSLCPAGTFTAAFGSTACAVCPSGTAAVTPGSTACQVVTQPPVSQPTVTKVTVSPGSTPSGVALTAQVTSTAGTPQGAVQFRYGTLALSNLIVLDASGTASATVSALPEGNLIITANYTPDSAAFSPSTGSTPYLAVNPTVQAGTAYCNPGALSSDGGASAVADPYPSVIKIPALGGSLAGLSVTLKSVFATEPQHLKMMLAGPGGRQFDFWSGVGDTPFSGYEFTLSDSAAKSLPTSINSGGTYFPTANNLNDVFPFSQGTLYYAQPHYPNTTFSGVFGGVDMSAPTTWSLFVTNGGPIQPAIIWGWCISPSFPVNTPTNITVTSSTGGQTGTGSPSTFTAHVVTASGANVGTGTVTFSENGKILAGPFPVDGLGNATFTTVLPEGSHAISATYSGVIGTLQPSAAQVVQVVLAPTMQAGSRFCNPNRISIGSGREASPYGSGITVSGMTGIIDHMSVTLLGLNSVMAGELQSLLVSPALDGAHAFDFFSYFGPGYIISTNQLTFSDSAPEATVPLRFGEYRPYSRSASNLWAAPVVAGPFRHAAPAGGDTFASVFGGQSPNGTWSLYLAHMPEPLDESSIAGGWCLNFDIVNPTTTAASNVAVAASPNSQSLMLKASVTSAAGPVNTGVVQFDVMGTRVTSATVAGGVALAEFTIPAGKPAGTYPMQATYSGAGTLLGSDAAAALTITGVASRKAP